MASGETPNMRMNDWVGTDGFKREEMRFNFLKLDSEMKERGANIKWFANNPAASDYTAAIKDANASLPEGMQVHFPPDRDYQITEPLILDRPLHWRGTSVRKKSTGRVFGGRIVVPSQIDQASMEAAITLNHSNIELEGIALKGNGAAFGGVGILTKSAWFSFIRKADIDGFNVGLKHGAGAAHVKCSDSLIKGCNDAIVFGNGNLFDFTFDTLDLTGNLRACAYLESNTSVESVTFFRTQFGWPTPNCILQGPTTTGDGFSLLRLIECPMEQVAERFIRMYNGGKIFIDGGYWTWLKGAQPANPAFQIDNVNVGEIEATMKLEPSYPNPNCPYFLYVPGYTNYDLKVTGSLNGFAQNWFNYGGSLPMRRLWVNGQSFGGQYLSAERVNVTNTTSEQVILEHIPLLHGNFKIRAVAQVAAPCNATLKIVYNNGNKVITKTVSISSSSSADDYPLEVYAHCYPYNKITISCQASVADAIKVSAGIEACH